MSPSSSAQRPPPTSIATARQPPAQQTPEPAPSSSLSSQIGANKMGRFLDCQLAVVPWGKKAKFRLSKLGLIKKGSTVYLAIFPSMFDYRNKFPIQQGSVEVLPAAIRFKDFEQDLFVKNVSDELAYKNLIREIKVLLKRDRLTRPDHIDQVNKFINSLPAIGDPYLKTLAPARRTARLVVEPRPNSISLPSKRNFDQSCDNCVGTTESHDVRRNSEPIDGSCPRIKRRLDPAQSRKLENDQLKCIKISGLEVIPKQLWLRSSLHELYLTDCNLTSIPKQLETFQSTLFHLDLSSNNIDKLPRSFCCRMNKLEILNLSHNQIETLPIEIKFFRRLVDLNISNNRLRLLPTTFSDLRRLRTLNVANNKLSQLPAFRREDIKLRYLDVSYNPFDGALEESNTFEVYPSHDESLHYNENLLSPISPIMKNKIPTLFELAILSVVRNDNLLKIASDESLPRTIISTMQRDVFKCYKCSRMNILPAYNSTDILDYVDQVDTLKTTGNYRHGMTFMKLVCRDCFDSISS